MTTPTIRTSVQDTEPKLRHVAVIMDGNNRWAKQRGLKSSAGHEAGAKRVRDIIDACQKYNIEVVTLFAFSSENWQRPTLEVAALMSLLTSYLKKEVSELKARKIRLRVIGGRDRFSTRLCKLIDKAESETRDGDRTLVLAIDYGGKWDITQAAKKIAQKVQDGDMRVDEITEQSLESQICLSDLPMPDLCIRTAGEQRVSNFLIWQMAYTEFYFADCYWPDFDGEAFDQAVTEYFKRQRRFGLSSDQLSEQPMPLGRTSA